MRNGSWSFNFTSANAVTLDGWLYYNSNNTVPAHFTGSYESKNITLGNASCGKNVITVAAYVSRYNWDAKDGGTYHYTGDGFDQDVIAPFSSMGPTRDGRQKPDVTAPGSNILSTRSSDAGNPEDYYLPPTGYEYYMYMQGTSMATPLTAGAVLLLKELKPSYTYADIINYFKTHSQGTTQYSWSANNWNAEWGWGVIDLEYLLALNDFSITSTGSSVKSADNITIEWETSASVASYDIIATKGTDETKISVDSGTTYTGKASSLFKYGDGTYTVKIVAKNDTATKDSTNTIDFTYDCLDAFDFTSPASETVKTIGDTVAFGWSQTDSGATYEFQVKIPGSDSYVSAGTTGTDISSASYTLEKVGDYYFRVVASKDGYDSVQTSELHIISASTVQKIENFTVTSDSHAKIIFGDNLKVVWDIDANDNNDYQYSYSVYKVGTSPDAYNTVAVSEDSANGKEYFEISWDDIKSEIVSGGEYTLSLKCTNKSNIEDYDTFELNFYVKRFKAALLPNLLNSNYLYIIVKTEGLESGEDNSLTIKDSTSNSYTLVKKDDDIYLTTDAFNQKTDFTANETFHLYYSDIEITNAGTLSRVKVKLNNGYKLANIEFKPVNSNLIYIVITDPSLAGLPAVDGKIFYFSGFTNSLKYVPDKDYKLVKYLNNHWYDVSRVDTAGYYAIVKGTVPGFFNNVKTLNNYPNPFNPETNVTVYLKNAGKLTLAIYNTKGRLVKKLVNGRYYNNGLITIHWDGKDERGKAVASGIYYAVAKINGRRYVRKMVLLK